MPVQRVGGQKYHRITCENLYVAGVPYNVCARTCMHVEPGMEDLMQDLGRARVTPHTADARICMYEDKYTIVSPTCSKPTVCCRTTVMRRGTDEPKRYVAR